ncbi:MAG TPA: phosphatidate cytidylyltransferase [Thermomicrobiales bacterium]|nr:phosphatidate cytidylyltransferase [Thermomicrobiales bacterium]
MRQRSISAIGVVAIGLVPAILGGWIFGVVFTAIVAIAYWEAVAITDRHRTPLRWIGLAIVVVAGLLATWHDTDRTLLGIIAGAVFLPLAAAVFISHTHGNDHWVTTTTTSLYLALPAWAAISLRQSEAFPARDWLQNLAGWFPGTSTLTGGGLAWLLLALLVTWLSDTFAFVVGKSVGRTKLAPRVSPNKTVEGALGGLVAAGLIALFCNWAFGMQIGPGWATVIGVGLGLVGQIGDLSESMLKRARGVKDSGHLIPGHGGMLDRIDALIFILVATWLIAPLVN